MQHHRDHSGLQARRALDRHIDRPWRFRLDPVAEPAQSAVGGDGGADTGDQRVKNGVPVGALNDSLDLGAVLVVIPVALCGDRFSPGACGD